MNIGHLSYWSFHIGQGVWALTNMYNDFDLCILIISLLLPLSDQNLIVWSFLFCFVGPLYQILTSELYTVVFVVEEE